MKLITFTSFGGAVPDAIKNYIETHDLADKALNNVRADSSLIAFIESFRAHNILDKNAFHVSQRNDPLSLFYHDTNVIDDISVSTYYGYCSNNHTGVQIAINEYDENKDRVIIETYDGKETLVKVPEYTPVTGIPGLFECV